MTGAILAAGLLALLAIGGIAGPRLLDRLALAHRPRTGILVWTGAAALWTLGLLALGPLLAWSLTGPVLPGGFGAVCRRCLEAASPFGAATLPVSAPPAAALALSGVLLLALTVALLRTHLRTRRELGSQLAALTATADPTTVAGVPVWLVRSSVPTAYALPGHPRVVVSEGTVEALDADQLGAVLSHEAAHLEQRHHLVLGLLRALRTVLGVVPLVAAAVPALAAATRAARTCRTPSCRRSPGTHRARRPIAPANARPRPRTPPRHRRDHPPPTRSGRHRPRRGPPPRPNLILHPRPSPTRPGPAADGGPQPWSCWWQPRSVRAW